MNESYRHSLSLHAVGVDEERSALENSSRSSTPPYNILTAEGILSRGIDVIQPNCILFSAVLLDMRC